MKVAAQRDLLKARLDLPPQHPRALLTFLEGLSLWCGHPLRVALPVDASCRAGLEPTLSGDELWPAESLALRQQLATCVRTRKRTRLERGERAFWVVLSKVWQDWRSALVLVKRAIVIAWHRRGYRRYWT